ncbi:hypothetical protein [Deinococcus hohokamensis]|uniref:Uncharacterized protein n=1 Tax=Deinococcus hohokamensis TaxID=309883 RepID=A0ABV9IBT2_9DEIO
MELAFSGSDFDPPESEQHLHIATGRTGAELTAWLRQQGGAQALNTATPLSAGEVALHWARFLALPLDAPQIDIGWVERGWCLRDDAMDATFVAAGQGRWVAWTWFTTA